jgi:hypothetical protein
MKSLAEDYPRFMAIMAAAFDRLTAGEKTYGAFDAETDRRDLRLEAEEELLDAIVYAYFAILRLEQAAGSVRPWSSRDSSPKRPGGRERDLGGQS